MIWLSRRLKILLITSLIIFLLTWSFISKKFFHHTSKYSETSYITTTWSLKTTIRRGSDLHYHSPFLSVTDSKPLTNLCPHVFIIGSRKGGTTSLYQYLSSHPHFNGIRLDWGPVAGETWWMSQEYDENKVSEYVQLFHHEEGFMTGEATVDYFVNCEVPLRLRTVCGLDAKIIVLLRDPTYRFISDYYMRFDINNRRYYPGSYFNTTASLSETIEREYNKFITRAHRQLNSTNKHSFLATEWKELKCLFREAQNIFYEGLYYAHVQNWLSNYPPQNILIVPSGALFSDTMATVAGVMEFVGLEELSVKKMEDITRSIYNYGRYDRSGLKEKDMKRLDELYKPFNQHLLHLLKWRKF